VDLSRDDAWQIDLRINGLYLPGAYVGYYQYGAPIVARSHADRHDYWINLPLEEPISATIGPETLICGPRQGFVSSPTLPYVVRTHGRGARVHVQVTQERLNRQLTALLERLSRCPSSLRLWSISPKDMVAAWGCTLVWRSATWRAAIRWRAIQS
jgi:hypothetical protein